MSRPEIIMVAACDRNGAIGKGNELPWKHRADMQMFKKLTTGGTVVMGSKTYLSMGAKPLPNRVNVVLTRYPDKFQEREGVHFITDMHQADQYATDGKLLIIGGENVYEQFAHFADVVHLSRLDLAVEDADAFFPDFLTGSVGKEMWDVVCIDNPAAGDDVAWQQCVYNRK